MKRFRQFLRSYRKVHKFWLNLYIKIHKTILKIDWMVNIIGIGRGYRCRCLLFGRLIGQCQCRCHLQSITTYSLLYNIKQLKITYKFQLMMTYPKRTMHQISPRIPKAIDFDLKPQSQHKFTIVTKKSDFSSLIWPICFKCNCKISNLTNLASLFQFCFKAWLII